MDENRDVLQKTFENALEGLSAHERDAAYNLWLLVKTEHAAYQAQRCQAALFAVVAKSPAFQKFCQELAKLSDEEWNVLADRIENEQLLSQQGDSEPLMRAVEAHKTYMAAQATAAPKM